MKMNRVITGEGRGAYVNLLTPKEALGGGDPKYSLTLLIPKSDTETKADIDVAIAAAKQYATENKWAGATPPNPRTPLADGDELKPNGEPYPENFKGHWVLNCSSTSKPDAITLSGKPITEDQAYSGAYYSVAVTMFGYSAGGNRGISAALDNVLFIRDGERFGQTPSAQDDFADLLKRLANQ